MKLIIICALFAPIIYFACRQKKWYLYLLFAFAAILPEQFSVRITNALPLLTGSRILIVIVMGFWIYDKWKTKKFHFPISLLAFFSVNLIISLVNLRYGMDDINRIFILVFERVLLVIMIKDMICDRKELDLCIDFAIMGCVVLALIGIVQTVFDYDIASVLHLTETITSGRLANRMGLVRAFGTYNAISFGCYCSFMAILILYRLYNTKSIWHSIAFSLTFVALVCTFTRSAWLCLAAIVFIALVLYRLTLIRRLLPSIGIILVLTAVLCCFQPKLYNAFVETGKSSLNTFASVFPNSIASSPHVDQTEESAPAEQAEQTAPTEETQDVPKQPVFELDEEFGANADDPTYSRMAQWTAIQYMTEQGQLLFGYGYNALLHRRIHFFFDRWTAKWQPTTFLDVGMVAVIAESGLLGALSYLGLLGYMIVHAFRQRSRKEKFDYYHLVFLIIPLYLLLNFMASFPNPSIVWLFFALFYTSQKLEKESTEAPTLEQE